METVINKLSEIEDAAHRIMEKATTQKKDIAKAMEQKTKDFDATVDKETLQKLEEIRTALKKDMDQELASLQANTTHILENSDKEYSLHHDAIATRIYEKLIRM